MISDSVYSDKAFPIFVSAAIATGTDCEIARYQYPLFIPTAIGHIRPYFEARLSITI
ncbi:MAG: hypothetical protein R3205_04615 [Psychrobacter sp.]|nr:hypothetical protein [Psychrobacter sp.]